MTEDICICSPPYDFSTNPDCKLCQTWRRKYLAEKGYSEKEIEKIIQETKREPNDQKIRQ